MYKKVHLENTLTLSKLHVDKVIYNEELKENIIEQLNFKLHSAALKAESIKDQLTDDYLEEIAIQFGLRSMWLFSSEGEMLLDSTKSLKDTFEVKEGDPIHNFMMSGLDLFFEGIRKSTINDTRNLYAYMRVSDGSFFEMSISATEVDELTKEYTYDTVVQSIVKNDKQVHDSFIINNDREVISSSNNVYNRGLYVVNDTFYDEAFNGKLISREKYSKTLKKNVLEIVSPLNQDEDNKSVISFYYSLEFYESFNKRISIMIIVLSVTTIVTFSSLIIYYLLLPLSKLEYSLSSFDAKSGSYSAPKRTNHLFYEAFNSIEKLSTHIVDTDIKTKELNENIYHLTINDYLTKLPNRSSVIKVINSNIEIKNYFSIIFIDLDKFKMFNDLNGHLFGDQILINFARILNEYANEETFISRYGGDEFIILYYVDDLVLVNQLVEDIYKRFKEPISISDNSYYIDFSTGISTYPLDGNESSDLIRKADLAMYESKSLGDNNSTFYTNVMDKILKEEIVIKETIESAINDDLIKVALVPQVNVLNNEFVSYEAVARIDESALRPSIFIKVAEKYNIINILGYKIIDQVINVFKEFKNNNLCYKTIYINLSFKQLNDNSVIDYLIGKLNKEGIPNKFLGIQITEDVFHKDEEIVKKFFTKLNRHGFKISIDNFGSKNASIGYLTNHSETQVKLNLRIIDGYLNNDNIHIYESMVKLASYFGYNIIAEGISSKEQVELLKQTSCIYAQGKYFSNPKSLKEIIKIEIDNNTK